MLHLGLAHVYWELAVGALLLGMFAEAARPAFSAMMLDVVPMRDRLRAFSLSSPGSSSSRNSSASATGPGCSPWRR
jgi:MFS family permease